MGTIRERLIIKTTLAQLAEFTFNTPEDLNMNQTIWYSINAPYRRKLARGTVKRFCIDYSNAPYRRKLARGTVKRFCIDYSNNLTR